MRKRRSVIYATEKEDEEKEYGHKVDLLQYSTKKEFFAGCSTKFQKEFMNLKDYVVLSIETFDVARLDETKFKKTFQ